MESSGNSNGQRTVSGVVLNRALLGFHQGWMLICLGLRVNRGVRDLLVKVCLLVVSNKDGFSWWMSTGGEGSDPDARGILLALLDLRTSISSSFVTDYKQTFLFFFAPC